jgi:hypothetical protein
MLTIMTEGRVKGGTHPYVNIGTGRTRNNSHITMRRAWEEEGNQTIVLLVYYHLFSVLCRGQITTGTHVVLGDGLTALVY